MSYVFLFFLVRFSGRRVRFFMPSCIFRVVTSINNKKLVCMIKYKLGSPETESDSNPIIERFWPTKKLVTTQLVFALFDVHCMMEAAPLARTWFCHGEIM